MLKLLFKHDVLPSSGSLPSPAAGLVSFAACLAFFFAFFPYKENNNGINRWKTNIHKGWGGENGIDNM